MEPLSVPPHPAKRLKQDEQDEQDSQEQPQPERSTVQPRQKSATMLDFFMSSNRVNLRALAAETLALLPKILSTVPHISTRSYTYDPTNLPRLHPGNCPGFPSVEAKVVNEDTVDAAINVGNCSRYITVRDKQPVCVLNMANAYTPGGGFRNGAMAQEEAICYRSSLYYTLKQRFYPLHEFGGLFSPTVLVFRHSDQRRTVMNLSRPERLPVICAISVAAICCPKTISEEVQVPAESTEGGEAGVKTVISEKYASDGDRENMKERMRVILRIAAYNRCRRLVLGAFGCGAFHNPNKEVANCWAEVLQETEFRGGWWESIVFAVFDPQNTEDRIDPASNYGVFHDILDGLMLS
ncbi:hypothetical protein KEM56_005492 [Ascosphaera pollenicola]|nr:hypothetical protein KEM56_005492 [Ascosphaera pollenicola]